MNVFSILLLLWNVFANRNEECGRTRWLLGQIDAIRTGTLNVKTSAPDFEVGSSLTQGGLGSIHRVTRMDGKTHIIGPKGEEIELIAKKAHADIPGSFDVLDQEYVLLKQYYRGTPYENAVRKITVADGTTYVTQPYFKDASGNIAPTLENLRHPELAFLFDSERQAEKQKFKRELLNLVGDMHKNGVVHGDLTRRNILWSNGLHLIDFGLGHRKVDGKWQLRPGSQGKAGGTQGAMDVESFLGNRVSEERDVTALSRLFLRLDKETGGKLLNDHERAVLKLEMATSISQLKLLLSEGKIENFLTARGYTPKENRIVNVFIQRRKNLEKELARETDPDLQEELRGKLYQLDLNFMSLGGEANLLTEKLKQKDPVLYASLQRKGQEIASWIRKYQETANQYKGWVLHLRSIEAQLGPDFVLPPLLPPTEETQVRHWFSDQVAWQQRFRAWERKHLNDSNRALIQEKKPDLMRLDSPIGNHYGEDVSSLRPTGYLLQQIESWLQVSRTSTR